MKILEKINPDQYPTSNLEIAAGESGCCGGGGVVCKYTTTESFPITSLEYTKDDVATTYTLPVAATTLAEFNAALSVLINGRKSEDGMGATTADSLYNSSIDGAGDLVFEVESDVVITAINGNAVTQECTPAKVTICKMELVLSSAQALVYDGGPTATVDVPGTGDEAGALAELITELGVAGVTYKDVTVVEDLVGGFYLATVEVVGECSLMTLDATASTFCGARPDYVA